MSNKVAFTSIYSNLTYNQDNHRGLETIYFKQLLEENGYGVDLIGKKGRNTKDLDFYKNYDQADWSEYGAIFVQLSPANFFGGQVGDQVEPIARSLAGFKGPIYALVNDPQIGFYNPVEKLKRFDLLQDLSKEWKEIIENAIYLFPGKKIEKYLGYVPKNWQRLDWFTYMFKHRMHEKVKEKSSLSLFDFDETAIEKEWDLVYYGDNRKSFREKQVVKYFGKETNNLLIGFKTSKAPATFMKKQPHGELLDTLSKCRASLITGDDEHMDNVATFRFYETLGSDCLAAIQIEYDPNKELIKDPILQEHLYVSSPEDVKKLIDSYSDKLIELQKKELRNIFQRLDIKFTIKQ